MWAPTSAQPEGGRTIKSLPLPVGAGPFVVSFDIDGTMEFGDPPGPIAATVALALSQHGHVVGVASDRPRSSQTPLWTRHGVEPRFVGGKHHLLEVRARFAADRYIHIGDTDVDASFAALAGFEFLHVDALLRPVTAEFVARVWRPESP